MKYISRRTNLREEDRRWWYILAGIAKIVDGAIETLSLGYLRSSLWAHFLRKQLKRLLEMVCNIDMGDLYECDTCGHTIYLENDDCDIDEYFRCRKCPGWYEIVE